MGGSSPSCSVSSGSSVKASGSSNGGSCPLSMWGSRGYVVQPWGNSSSLVVGLSHAHQPIDTVAKGGSIHSKANIMEVEPR